MFCECRKCVNDKLQSDQQFMIMSYGTGLIHIVCWIVGIQVSLCHVNNKNCNGYQDCYFKSITCSSSMPCNVTCNGYQACFYATINCPNDWSCTISCDDDYGCYGLTIYGPKHCGATLDIYVGYKNSDETDETAKSMNIYASDTDSINIYVKTDDSAKYAFSYSNIYASNSRSLNITADGYYAFEYNTIKAPKHGTFSLEAYGNLGVSYNEFDLQNATSAIFKCYEENSCYDNLIYGYTMQGDLTLIGYYYRSLRNLEIYCPQNGPYGGYSCNIIGEIGINDDTTDSSSSGILYNSKIYAVEGLTDAYYTCRQLYNDTTTNTLSYKYNEWDCFYNASMYCGRYFNWSAKEYQLFKKSERCLLYYNTTFSNSDSDNDGYNDSNSEWKCKQRHVLNTSSTYCETFLLDEAESEDNSITSWFYNLFYDDTFAWFIAAFLFFMVGLNFCLFCYAIWRKQGED